MGYSSVMAHMEEYRPKQSRALVTVNALLDAAIEEIETLGEDGVRVETVLDKAGVSIGSLYHHFGGREQLIEAARVEQVRRFHSEDLRNIQLLMSGINSVDDLFDRMEQLSQVFHDPNGVDVRLRRLALLGSAVTRYSLLATTREARLRSNQMLMDVFQDLKDRRILNDNADPATITMFIQAFSFGQVLADIDGISPDPEHWPRLSKKLVLMVMGLAEPDRANQS
jgi:AcrR family transcriptional regulator